MNISRETLQQNKTLRVIKAGLGEKRLEMFAEIAEKKDDYNNSYEQLGKCMKLGVHEDPTNRIMLSELLRYQTSMPGAVSICLKDYVDRIKDGPTDIHHIIGVRRWPRAPVVLRRTLGWPQRACIAHRAQRIAQQFVVWEARNDALNRPICERCGYRVNRVVLCTSCVRSCCDEDFLSCMWDDSSCVDCLLRCRFPWLCRLTGPSILWSTSLVSSLVSLTRSF